MNEYTILQALEQYPWLVVAGVFIVVVILLPSRIAVQRGRRRRVEYISPIVRYVSTPEGWIAELRGVAGVQRALLEVIGWLWTRAKGVIQAQFWVILRAWIVRW